ncbi:MAG: putative membrane protein [Pseudohongiellaceae bacterium]|jgi:uncharacterized membrane protein
MDKLKPQFLESCRKDKGRTLRGEGMTRIETFVDAAFAFAFTMLVISIDEIPQSPTELIELSKDIPAFILSAALIGWIWVAHTRWSRTFGLQDSLTVFLSLSLVVLVLISVYPIKLMVQATVIYFSNDILDTGLFDNGGWDNNSVASLFVYFSFGLFTLAVIIVSLYWNALRFRAQLVLSQYEIYYAKYSSVSWLVLAATALVSCVLAVTVPPPHTVVAANIYFSLFVSVYLAQYGFRRLNPRPAC